MSRSSTAARLAALVGLLGSLAAAVSSAPPAPASAPAKHQPDLSILSSLPRQFTWLATPRFMLFYHAPRTGKAAGRVGDSPSAGWAERMGRLLEAIHDRFRTDFQTAGFKLQPSGEPLTWICFPPGQDYADYTRQADRMDLSWMDAYYSARTNRVAMSAVVQRKARPAGDLTQALCTPEGIVWPDGLDIVRVSHEAAHQLAFNTGLQKRRVMYPLWLAEGLATSFEADPGGTIGLGRENAARLDRLRDANRRSALRGLDGFVQITRVPQSYLGAADDCYAQSYGLFRYLLTTRPAQLRAYLELLARQDVGYRDEATLRREFVQAFGPLSELEKDWTAHLKALTSPRPAPRAATQAAIKSRAE